MRPSREPCTKLDWPIISGTLTHDGVQLEGDQLPEQSFGLSRHRWIDERGIYHGNILCDVRR